MVVPINLRADYGSLEGDERNRIIASKTPVLSWGAETDVKNDYQIAFKVKVLCGGKLCWESGIVKSNKPSVKYGGEPLPTGKRIDFSVSVAGNDGILSDEVSEHFYVGSFDELPSAKWICATEDKESVPAYFERRFSVADDVTEAAAFISGIGYSTISINGEKADCSVLNPAVSDYNKTCFYAVIPNLQSFFKQGENTITVSLADGWRRNWGDYLRIYNNTPSFFGTPCLWCAVRLTFADGREEWILSDESWKWGRGNVTFSHLFDGEVYDASVKPTFNTPVKLYTEPLGVLKPMTVPPITPRKEYSPVSLKCIEKGRYIADFGTNMAGVVRIKLPKGLKSGLKITIRHAQLLHGDGTLNTDNLRGALCEDTYIASGDGNDLDIWQPEFTYHGFRYAEICGIELLQKEDLTAVMLCTDLPSRSHFKCGSAVMNAVNDMLIQTERSTTHGLFNDTCGRSERLNWINDGYVRYNEIAYNFEIGKIFPHVMSVIRDTQNADGSLTCTAPHVYGKRPADPLNSSYLMLAEEAYLRTGNKEILEEYYPSLCTWQKCLLDNSDGYIMSYSYYGDWAGPKYSRDPNTMGGGAGSASIPAVMVGTGTLIKNAQMLKSFSEILGKDEEAKYYGELYEKAKNAFLEKWYNPDERKVYNGSQSCQALALWLGILPEEHRRDAARLMRDDLVNSGYRFTTGVFCLRFMCEMLLEYGYVDEFYELMTREEYPSYGYMLQCGATTGWEKYEYLTGNSMNAHIHPTQSAVAQCFYKYIAGIVPMGEGSEEVLINPHYPKKLLTASMAHSTVRGDITVSWRKTEGKTELSVSVPFNTTAHIRTPSAVHTVGSGFYTFSWQT